MQSINIVSSRENVIDCLRRYKFHAQLNRFRESEKQQAALLKVLEKEGNMCIAAEDETIVGYTLIVSPEEHERWSYLPFLKILGAIEVAPPYRGHGLAKKVVKGVLADPTLEQFIILSLEYAWHWDLNMVNGDIELYKDLLKKVLASGRFQEAMTDEPDIASSKHNFMMARYGKQITADHLNEFMKLANHSSIF